MSQVAAQLDDILDFDEKTTFCDWIFRKPSRRVQAAERRSLVNCKKAHKSAVRRKEVRFANIEKFVFDANVWEKPCIKVDGSYHGLWVDADGNPQDRKDKDGLMFVLVGLDKPLNLARMAELAKKAKAKSSITLELRCWCNTAGQALTVNSVKADIFGDGCAIVKEVITFEYEVTTNTLKVYKPHAMGNTNNLSRSTLVYANMNGKKTAKQAKLTAMFGERGDLE